MIECRDEGRRDPAITGAAVTFAGNGTDPATSSEPVAGNEPVAEMPDAVVFRHELVHRFTAAVAKKLVVVVAPPGYGKSVLIGQWARTVRSRRIAWMAVGPAGDPSGFARRLCAAMSAVDGRPRERIADQVPFGGEQLGQPFLSAFLADVRTISPTVLVLDDLPVAENGALLAELASLIDQAPPQLHFVVAARMDPPLRHHRLRMSDQFAEFRQDDLVFEPAHAREMIRLIAHREVTDDQLALLLERTEGWGAGLQLAALSLRHVTDVDRFVGDFAGDDRHVAEYLTAHVLEHLSPDVRRFLLETSMLDQLSAPLCDAVTGRHDAKEMLERLAVGALFVTRVTGRRGWFRYHQLFRTLLQHRLRESDGTVEAVLLERAADWHFANGDIETAVDYLCAAGANDRILTAIQMYGHALHATGRMASAVRWLDCTTPPAGRRRTGYLLLGAAVSMLAGDVARADARLAEVEADPATGPGDRTVADVIRTWSVHDCGRPETVTAAVGRVLTRLDTTDPVEIRDVMNMITPDAVRQMVLVNGAVAAAYAGRSLQARVSIRGARAEPRRLVAAEIEGLGTAALLDAWGGRLRSAQQQGARALAIADQSAVSSHPSTIAARLALAQVARERSALDQARTHQDVAATLIQRSHRSVLQALLATEAASLLGASGDPGRALTALAQQRLDSPAMPAAVGARRDAVIARLMATVGDPRGALQLLGRGPYGHVELVAAAVRATVELGDLDAARRLLDTWPHDDEPGNRIQFTLWQCIVDDITSDGGGTDPRLVDVFAAGRREGHVRLYLDAGHHALRLVRAHYHGHPTPYLRQLVDAAHPGPQASPLSASELVEQLTGREFEVLRYLATTLDNAEIAAEIGVSVNTLKTHLKHIYRKLGVERRRTAIVEAERLHLL
jgi:LuxR family maltose regulon positive regulatory protein